MIKQVDFPIQLIFNITTLSNDFTAKDATGKTIAYVKQKIFKLKEAITVYEDETKNKVNYTIKADQWLDFSAAYLITDNKGTGIGKIVRKGWASLWKAEYELIDQNQKLQYKIREENGWIKVFDKLLGEIPILGILTGYLFNPSYKVTNLNDEIILRLKKQASFFGRKFEISKLKETDNDDDERVILGLMMMILLERQRG